jgi:hypothetical protein
MCTIADMNAMDTYSLATVLWPKTHLHLLVYLFLDLDVSMCFCTQHPDYANC